jgi:hypothetical protein
MGGRRKKAERSGRRLAETLCLAVSAESFAGGRKPPFHRLNLGLIGLSLPGVILDASTISG